MTDRIKGLIVHFDKDIREDNADRLIDAIKCIKRVSKVKRLLTEARDSIDYERGVSDTKEKFYKLLRDLDD